MTQSQDLNRSFSRIGRWVITHPLKLSTMVLDPYLTGILVDDYINWLLGRFLSPSNKEVRTQIDISPVEDALKAGGYPALAIRSGDE